MCLRLSLVESIQSLSRLIVKTPSPFRLNNFTSALLRHKIIFTFTTPQPKLTPLKLVISDKEILTNPKPSSPHFTRPLHMIYKKERTVLTVKEEVSLRKEIEDHRDLIEMIRLICDLKSVLCKVKEKRFYCL